MDDKDWTGIKADILNVKGSVKNASFCGESGIFLQNGNETFQHIAYCHFSAIKIWTWILQNIIKTASANIVLMKVKKID